MLPKFTEHSTRVWDFIANKMQFLLQAIRLVKEMGPQPEVSAGKCRGVVGTTAKAGAAVLWLCMACVLVLAALWREKS